MVAARPHESARLASLLVGLALVAAACAGTDTTDDSGAVSGDPDGGSASTEPLDLSTSVSANSERVTVVTDSPDLALAPDVRAATASWPTDWTRQTVDIGELRLGIPTADPRDRIPPIDIPKFEPIGAATWLGDREPGALVQFNDEVRFFPL
ncbi:MAG: hypothetical protein GY724_24115, partial [Actinomycetia bacterium]|nr:hypothetical protein [Actinomycetes bacterium]